MCVRLHRETVLGIYKCKVLGGLGGTKQEELLLPHPLAINESLQTYIVLEDVKVASRDNIHDQFR